MRRWHRRGVSVPPSDALTHFANDVCVEPDAVIRIREPLEHFQEAIVLRKAGPMVLFLVAVVLAMTASRMRAQLGEHVVLQASCKANQDCKYMQWGEPPVDPTTGMYISSAYTCELADRQRDMCVYNTETNCNSYSVSAHQCTGLYRADGYLRDCAQRISRCNP
jgi:hypothetical protein